MRGAHGPQPESSPGSEQLEKAHEQQWKPGTAKNIIKKKKKQPLKLEGICPSV